MASLTGLARRAGWNIVDQALSALGNMLLMVVVARSVDAVAFGAFAVGFLVYSISVAVGRSFVGQPLQIRHSDETPEAFRESTRDAQATTVALGVAGGVISAGVGAALGGGLGGTLIAVAACLPFLMLQDTLRMAFITNKTPQYAAVIDAVKVVAQFALLYVFLSAGWNEVGLLTLSWGIAAILSAGAGMVLLKALPRFTGIGRWWRRQRDLSTFLLAEYTLGLGAAQLGSLLVPILGTQRDAGAIRGGETLLGPLNVLGTALLGFAVPEVSRSKGAAPGHRIKAMLAMSGGMALVAVTYSTVLILLPDEIGVELFGDSWAGAQSVLLPMGLNAVASALALGPGAMLIGMGLARKTFRLNLVKAPILLGVLVPATLEAGAVGAAWAIFLSEAVMLPFWAVTAWRAAHGRYRHLVADQDAGPERTPEGPERDAAAATAAGEDLTPRPRP
ncbi:hypothetical protein [Agilicoccus flavus]|uniref:hypothetical protein n=1 Tax=Agilicoccus flavus TaxID=2775968 RepID=UPI001CF693D8|nr:hypothetical protein [Agilicoccus flavus]